MTEPTGSSNPQGNAGSSSPVTWKGTLAEDLRSQPVISNFSDDATGLASLVKEHVNVQQLIGRQGVKKPKEGDAADLRRYYTELGCPSTPEGYDTPKVDIPERLAPFFSEDKISAMKRKAYELGIPKQAFEPFAEEYIKGQVADYTYMTEQSAAELKENDALLRKQWGMSYEQNKTLAVKVSEAYATSDSEKEFLALHGNNPALVSMMARIGKDVSEDSIAQARSQSTIPMLTPDQARAEANKLMASPAFMDGKHPENAAVKKRVTELFKMAK